LKLQALPQIGEATLPSGKPIAEMKMEGIVKSIREKRASQSAEARAALAAAPHWPGDNDACEPALAAPARQAGTAPLPSDRS